MSNVELGDEVKCKVTGHRGIVTGITKHLTGCDRATVQPPVQKDGRHSDAYAIDLAALTVIKKGKVKPESVREEVKKGGPATKVPRL